VFVSFPQHTEKPNFLPGLKERSHWRSGRSSERSVFLPCHVLVMQQCVYQMKLCQKYSYEKLSKSVNWFSSYSQKCRRCFL